MQFRFVQESEGSWIGILGACPEGMNSLVWFPSLWMCRARQMLPWQRFPAKPSSFRASDTDIPSLQSFPACGFHQSGFVRGCSLLELCQGKLQVLSLWNLTLLHFEAKHKEDSAPWPQHSWSVRQIPPEPDGNGGALGIPCARVSPCPRSWEQLPLLPAALYPSGYRLSLQSWEAWLSDRQLPPVPVHWGTRIPLSHPPSPGVLLPTGCGLQESPADTGMTCEFAGIPAACFVQQGMRFCSLGWHWMGRGPCFLHFFCPLTADIKQAPAMCSVELNPGSQVHFFLG